MQSAKIGSENRTGSTIIVNLVSMSFMLPRCVKRVYRFVPMMRLKRRKKAMNS
jgi:hypothetical protein